MPQTPQEVLNLIREQNIKIIDLKFIDTPGTWQHLTLLPRSNRRKPRSLRAYHSTVPAFAVGKPSTSQT